MFGQEALNPVFASQHSANLPDTALMMAIIDRLLHHGEVFYMRGSSYRMRGKEPVTLNAKGDGFLEEARA